MENFVIANCTDTGRVRQVNEDSMATFDSPNGRVVVVCDGMGGQNAGDVASQLAIAVIKDILEDNTFPTPEEAITRSMVAANQAILRRAAQNPELTGMGTTCVMLIIREGKVYYGSVGDSRIYYVADGDIRQITKDQSYVQTLVDAGEISQATASVHKDKNQLTNAIGVEGMTPPVVSQMPIEPAPGSVFLLCSDGLTGMVSNSLIKQMLENRTLTLEERAIELVKMANNAGGLDNITVQLVEFSGAANSTAARMGAAGGAGASQAAKRQAKRNRKMTYSIIGCAAVLLICAGFIVWNVISKPEPKPEKDKSTIVATPARKPAKRQTPAASEPTTVVKEIVVVKEPQSGRKETNKIIGGGKKNPSTTITGNPNQGNESERIEIQKGNYSSEKGNDPAQGL